MTERPKHGSFIRLEDLKLIRKEALLPRLEVLCPVIPSQAFKTNPNKYDYLFKDLVSSPENLLANTTEVMTALRNLGAAMKEDANAQDDNSEIPAAYTYLGQFIDHDITLEAVTSEIAEMDLNGIYLKPIPPQKLRAMLKNARTGTFDLDSVYNQGNAPRENGFLKIGTVDTRGIPQIRDKSTANDLPRVAGTLNADIGDSRNDENTIIAQLHVAMLKFHNAVMRKCDVPFETAEIIVRQHYQWIVLHDFLKRICDVEIVDNILNEGNKLYNPTKRNFFMPVEFSAAAFRFGHSMVRKRYNFNEGHDDTSLALLFRFAGAKGDLGGMEALPKDWIIEWDRFLPFGNNSYNKARKIDTQLSSFLHGLGGNGVFQVLAQTNLLRGYLLSLPTGQALARKVLGDEGVLTGEQILENASEAEKAALKSAGLHTRTPLWYYILAEASIQNKGMYLGKLGSTIVAETIIGLIRCSSNSILNEINWKPTLGDSFNLQELIRFIELGPGQAETLL